MSNKNKVVNDRENTVNLTIRLLSVIIIIASLIELSLVVLNVYDLINVIQLGQQINIIHVVANIGLMFCITVLEFSMGVFGLKGINDRKALKKSRTCSIVCFSLVFACVLLNAVNRTFKPTMISELMFPLAFLMVTFGKNMGEAMNKAMDQAKELKAKSDEKKKNKK